MKNFVSPGKVVPAAAPTGGVVTGAGVLIGSIFGVAASTVAEDALFDLMIEGVFDLPAAAHATDQAFAVGDPVFWDAAENEVTKTATGNRRVGYAVAAKASTATVARVVLAPLTVVDAQGAHVADAANGADAAALVTKINALLASLRTTGVIASS